MDNVSSLLDKRASITGGSRGIGAAIARKLAILSMSKVILVFALSV
jgi:NAD(P)-dependent dehydrogenase (short-subunit alcohol dehydrogenase family)